MEKKRVRKDRVLANDIVGRSTTFPLSLNDKMQYPTKATCAWCDRERVSEPNSMAVLSAGALLVNRKTGNGGPDDRLDGFMSLVWHGAHEDGQGSFPDIYRTLEVVGNARGGQFDVKFCSTKCLRAFLNYCVDQLETKQIEPK